MIVVGVAIVNFSAVVEYAMLAVDYVDIFCDDETKIYIWNACGALCSAGVSVWEGKVWQFVHVLGVYHLVIPKKLPI